MHDHHEKFESVALHPSSGGVFEVTLDGQVIFSKKQEGRFPEDDEILTQIESL